MSEWKPIETVPKDGNSVDLWIHRLPKTIKDGWRVADANFTGKYWTKNGKYLTGRHFYDDEGDECYDPDLADEGSTIISHWMPLPEPPEEKA